MYRKLFLTTCLVVLTLLISSGTMAQGPTTPEGGAGSSRTDSPAPDEAYSVDASMGTAFTYQGRIKKDGSPVNGTCNMTFSLWDNSAGGTKLGEKSVPNVVVSDGLFTVALDFGTSAFNGQKRYLGISVQCPAGTGNFVALTPNQELLAAPYAIHAQHATALSASDGSPIDVLTADANGNVWSKGALYIQSTDIALQGRGGGVGNNGGAGRALVDGGAADGLVINWVNDFGKVRINGSVGINTSTPGRPLEIGNTASASDGVIRYSHRNASNYRSWDVGTGDPAVFGSDDNFGIRDVTGNATRLVIMTNGNVGIGTVNPQAKLDVAGLTRTDVLQIDGGADLAEPFAIAGQPEPGQVVVIDPDHVGQLRIADQPYDRMVAGVISGAGGLRPGLIMQQQEIVQGETHPVALTGRVYVWADASFGAIQPGDLLTTSTTPGHAMKVTDHAKAQGAVIGKAMSSLDQGRAFILVLVSLQ
jgi:hypothetical protein